MRGVKITIMAAVFSAISLSSCVQPPEFADMYASIKGNWQMAADYHEKLLGPADKYAGYFGFTALVKKGDTIIIRGEFPHCRYISFAVYDQDFKVADALTGKDIVPLTGVNPFLPDVDRSSAWLGEYEITVMMEPPPEGERPPNTLYAGRALSGEPNKVLALGYRVYLPDKGYRPADNNPLGIAGGVPVPIIQLFNPDWQPYTQSNAELNKARRKLFWSIFKANKSKMKNPALWLGEPLNPPVWINFAGKDERRASTVVPNDDTAYIAVPVSSKYGKLLVLRWHAAKTSQQTFTGNPFIKDEDMQYWSVSFAYVESAGSRKMILTERTFADVDTSVLPDGTRQIVIGFDRIEKPASVAPDQWLGVPYKDGFLIMRNIVIRPGYGGDFGNLKRGPITGQYDKYTPGGVYCSVEEFENNPDIGLSRPELMNNEGE